MFLVYLNLHLVMLYCSLKRENYTLKLGCNVYLSNLLSQMLVSM